jgi:hypothetical protein
MDDILVSLSSTLQMAKQTRTTGLPGGGGLDPVESQRSLPPRWCIFRRGEAKGTRRCAWAGPVVLDDGRPNGEKVVLGAQGCGAGRRRSRRGSGPTCTSPSHARRGSFLGAMWPG